MADTSMALAVVPENGVDAYRMSTNAATVCGEIVRATAQTIQGKKYVRVEGWQAIAIAHGCSASSCAVEVVEGGIRATGQVRRMDTGQVIAEAEGFVGDDERMWAGRPMFARRAMAQTRAISRACRSAFAHVVILIDKDLGTTPAEEMQGVVDYEPNHPGNAQTRSLNVDPADRNMVKGDGRSQYQVDKEKKALNLVKETARLAIGMCQNRPELSAWIKANKAELAEKLPQADYDAIIEAVDARWDELPAPEKVA
jgi:hypothetical protein